MKKENKPNEIQIGMNVHEAIFLWNLLKDVLSQDAEGKNSGQGGILFPQDVGKATRLMDPLAQAIDDFNKANNIKVERPKPSWTLL